MADSFASAVFASYLLIIVLMVVISFNVKPLRGDKSLAWRTSNVAALLSVAAYLLPPMQPDVLRQTLVNLLVLLTGLSGAYAVLLQIKRRPPVWLYGAILAPLLGFVIYYLSIETDMRRRLFVNGILMALMACYMAAELAVAVVRRRNRYYSLLFVTFVLVAGAHTLRTFWIGTVTGISDAALQATAVGVGLAINLFLFVSWNLIFYTLIIDDARQQLRASQERLQDANNSLERQVAERTADLQATVAALESTAAELRRANAGKDAFLAAVSHELRTPLTAILSLSDLLAGEAPGPLNAAQAKYVTIIHRGGQRLAGTVDSILLYTSLMAGKFTLECEPCNLAQLCAIAAHSIMPTAEQKRQIITQRVEPADLTIESDPKSVLQMLKCLLDNAVKFTPEAGQISVVVNPGYTAAGDAAAQIAVSDTGIGMSDEQMAALFRAFTQGDMTLARRFEGLGLGLAYVHKLSERLGGSISVHSELGQGSRFTLVLPCSPPLHRREATDESRISHA